MPGSVIPFHAVLFDMDGTLVDTEPLWQEAERALMGTFGLVWTEADQARSLGGSTMRVSRYMAELIEQAGQVPPEAEELAGRFLEFMVAQIESQPPPLRDGAAELLTDVRDHGIPTALVSSSSRTLVSLVLGHLGSHWFDVTISANDVDRHKPDPLPYLEAARLLGVDPSWCLAIEDSPTGSDSAQRAGAYVLGIEHMAAIPPAPRRHVRDTLAGVTVDALGEMFEAPTTGELDRSRTA